MNLSTPQGLISKAFKGPPAYVPRTGWPVWAALLAAIAIFVAATIAGQLFVEMVPRTPDGGLDTFRPLDHAQVLAWILGMQLATIALTVIAGWSFDSRPRDCLALRAPVGGWAAFLAALLVLAASIGLVSLTTYIISPQSLTEDLQPFVEMAASGYWPGLIVAVGIGAPLSEELLFRGFLFSALARSKAGVRGAAIITSAAWTALHPNYSLLGLIEIFVIGLVLSWLLWRTGSLWITIFCHAAYNLTIVAVMLLFLVPA